MKIINSIILAVAVVLLSACSQSGTSKPSHSSDPGIQALEAAQSFVRSSFASDADFHPEGTIIEPTSVPDRYKIIQQFDSDEQDGYNFIYRIWVQKFPSGWEYSNLQIERAGGKVVHLSNGRMKELESMDGVGDKLTAGGIDFVLAEKKPSVIRIYTNNKLSREQLKAAIIDLKDKYESIQFATTEKHDRGDEYASWTADMFFDYDTDEIIEKSKFFQ